MVSLSILGVAYSINIVGTAVISYVVHYDCIVPD
jgi:hypothetical protein